MKRKDMNTKQTTRLITLTIADGNGKTLGVLVTPYPAVARLTGRFWKTGVEPWRRTGEYRIKTERSK
jgi:hypothetical protein